LAERNIEVYWCSGTTDQPERWPAGTELPSNVVTFVSTVIEDVTHRRDGQPIATIYGCGHDPRGKQATDFIVAAEHAYSIALAHGEIDTDLIKPLHGIRYWALGGRHKMAKTDLPECTLAHPGTPQGRNPRESGNHGCLLGRVDTNGKLRLQEIDLDVVRWLPQKVGIAETISEKDLQTVLSERALQIAANAKDQTVLVDWQLSTSGDFHPGLRRQDLCDRVLEWLRAEFGGGRYGVWSTRVSIDPPDSLPTAWYEEDTILGEYLRAVGRFQSDESITLPLHEYLDSDTESELLAGMGRVDRERREAVLRQSALVGIEYLGAHKEAVQPVAEDAA
jgi:DNA repair exonuclease SbcCD nuclease subunit